MNKEDILDLELMVVEQAKGKLSLIQHQQERESIVFKELEKILTSSEGNRFSNSFNDHESKHHFVRGFLSYGVVDEFLAHTDVEDIVINALKPIYIHHNYKGFVATDKSFKSQKELNVFIAKLLVFSGLDRYGKITNLALPNLGGRANIVQSPFGPQLTLTKAKVDPISIIDLIDRGSLDYQTAAQLWMYVEGMSVKPANIIIAGGPGTGKTTLLNALLPLVPVNERLIVIEDTLELNTALIDSCSRLESDDEVSLADLVKNTLRMRPERIIVGEVRGEEAADMITAVNVGKYCMGTIHALTAREAIIRLQNQPMNVPKTLVNLIDVFIILKRYHIEDKMFRVVEEVSETGAIEHDKILLATVCKYNYDQGKIIPTSPSTVYRDRLAKEAGVTPKDVIDETMIRAHVLQALHKKEISTLKEVCIFCKAYYEDAQDAMARIGLNRKQLLEGIHRQQEKW